MAKTEKGDEAVHVAGLRKFLRVLNTIPKELQNEIRDASQAIASDMVAGAKANAHTPLQALVAGGLSAKRDRVPVIKTSGMVRPGVRTRDVFYGAEFGGGKRPTTMQFPPHKGQQGYFLYPYARAHGSEYMGMWVKAIDDAFKAWDDDTARRSDA